MNRARVWAGSIVIATLLMGAMDVPAGAYSSASRSGPVEPPRYAVCREEREVYRPAPRTTAPRASDQEALLPLARTARPSALPVVPHQVDDLVVVGPVPSRAMDARPPVSSPEAPIVFHESRNDFQCLGFVRGRAGILRAIGAPPGARFVDHVYARDWVDTNMVAAGLFDLRETRDAIRSRFDRALAKKLETYEDFERLQLKAQAADALARLGDREYAPKIREWLVTIESTPAGTMWRETLSALRVLAPDEASAYAIDALERRAHAEATHAEFVDDGELLNALTAAHRPRVFALLDGPGSRFISTAGKTYCRAYAARARLGDAALIRRMRTLLAESLVDVVTVNCYGDLMPWVYPGREASEAPVLVFRQRWHSMMHLATSLREKHDPVSAKAQRILRDGILKVAPWAELTAPNTALRTAFIGRDRAAAILTLAILGEPQAAALVESVVANEEDDVADGPSALLEYAFEAGYTVSARSVAARFLRNAKHGGNHAHVQQREYEEHGGVMNDSVHAALVLALASKGDARFALGLLDRQIGAREEAMYHLARQKPRAACELVANAAAEGAEESSVQAALWALSIMGDACHDAAASLAKNANAPPYARSMAHELLAMLRAKDLPQFDTSFAANELTVQASLARARIISRSLE